MSQPTSRPDRWTSLYAQYPLLVLRRTSGNHVSSKVCLEPLILEPSQFDWWTNHAEVVAHAPRSVGSYS